MEDLGNNISMSGQQDSLSKYRSYRLLTLSSTFIFPLQLCSSIQQICTQYTEPGTENGKQVSLFKSLSSWWYHHTEKIMTSSDLRTVFDYTSQVAYSLRAKNHLENQNNIQ